MSHCIYNFSTVLYLNGITLHWNNNHSLSFPLPKDQQGEKKSTSAVVFTSVPSLKVLNSFLGFENLMTKWHLTLIFCFLLLRRKKKKGGEVWNLSFWRTTGWLQTGFGTGWRRQGRGRGPVSWLFPYGVSKVRLFFVALCTFHGGSDLTGTWFVYCSTFPVSASGNLRAGSLLADFIPTFPSHPILQGWLQPPVSPPVPTGSPPAPRLLLAPNLPLIPAPGRVW